MRASRHGAVGPNRHSRSASTVSALGLSRHAWVVALMLGLVTASLAVWWITRDTLPREIHIAAGVKGGQYYRFAHLLQSHLAQITGRPVIVHETAGSRENHQWLEQKRADLALVQLGPLGLGDQTLITPLYPEVVHVIVRRHSGLASGADLAGKRIGISPQGSGMRESALRLLEHTGLAPQSMTLEETYFTALEREPDLDGVMVTAGVLNQDLVTLLRSGRYRILDLPSAHGIAMTQPFFQPFSLPQGLYRSGANAVPDHPVQTIATTAVLAGHEDISDALIEAALQAIFETDLYYSVPVLLTKEEASSWAAYPKHPAARAYFNPYEGIDLLANFLESLSAGRELLVALFAGFYLIWSGVSRRRERERKQELLRQKQRLDQYLTRTIGIEQSQIGLRDLDRLAEYLAEVTKIKLSALRELTDEELRADHAFQIFLTQCANLSRKIEGRLNYLRGAGGGRG